MAKTLKKSSKNSRKNKTSKASRRSRKQLGGDDEDYSEKNPKVKAILDKYKDPKFQDEDLTPEERELFIKHMRKTYGLMWLYM